MERKGGTKDRISYPFEEIEITMAPAKLVLRAKVNNPVVMFHTCTGYGPYSYHGM